MSTPSLLDALPIFAEVPPAIAPDPDTPSVCVQLASLYNVNVTLPVGFTPDAIAAELPSAYDTLSRPVLGDACVVADGDALPITICSLASPETVVKPLLLASPP